MKYCPGGWALSYNEVFLNVAKIKDTVISSFRWTANFAKETFRVISLQHKIEHLCLNVIQSSLSNSILCVFHLLYIYHESLIASPRQRQEEKRVMKWKLHFFSLKVKQAEHTWDWFWYVYSQDSIIVAWIGLLISMKTQSNALFSPANGIRLWFNLN